VGHTAINAWGHTDLYSLLVTSTSKLTDWAKNPRAFTPGSVNWGSFAPIVGIPIFSFRLPLHTFYRLAGIYLEIDSYLTSAYIGIYTSMLSACLRLIPLRVGWNLSWHRFLLDKPLSPKIY
jgi:hypothetical protein